MSTFDTETGEITYSIFEKMFVWAVCGLVVLTLGTASLTAVLVYRMGALEIRYRDDMQTIREDFKGLQLSLTDVNNADRYTDEEASIDKATERTENLQIRSEIENIRTEQTKSSVIIAKLQTLADQHTKAIDNARTERYRLEQQLSEYEKGKG